MRFSLVQGYFGSCELTCLDFWTCLSEKASVGVQMSSERNPLLHDDFHDPYADQDGNLEPNSVVDQSYDSSEIASFESIHCVNEVYRSVPQIDSRYF